MTISRAAEAAPVGVETIRFYERLGLIERPPRPAAGGYREYDEDTIRRIRFIRQARELGFTLREAAALLALRSDPAGDCADVRARALEKREAVDRRIERLLRMRGVLDELAALCPGSGGLAHCSILDAIDRPPRAAKRAPDAATETERVGAMKISEFAIDGMHCEGCAQTIEALLGRTAGVRRVEASYGERRARVMHDPAALDEAEIARILGAAGFRATPQP